mmetsp:Transcript_1409/g.2169  ORF Transcript_1409/g.2169 Transcript_1409/m.2169 type:complete len:185 (-) Transcript_1409:1147-1701(-)
MNIVTRRGVKSNPKEPCTTVQTEAASWRVFSPKWKSHLTVKTGASPIVSTAFQGATSFWVESPSAKNKKSKRLKTWNTLALSAVAISLFLLVMAHQCFKQQTPVSSSHELNTHQYFNQTPRIIEENHIEELLNRLRRIDGITVDESRFYQVIAKAGGNLNEITDTIKNQLRPDVPHHERVIFVH